MDRPRARGGRGRAPREGHRISRGHGGARPLWQALPGLRRAGAAHRVRRERNQLLRALPDRRQDPRRSRPIAAAQEELAALPGGIGMKKGSEQFSCNTCGAHLFQENCSDPFFFGVSPMNRRTVLALLALGAVLPAAAQEKKKPAAKQRVVIQVSDNDPAKWNLALNNA